MRSLPTDAWRRTVRITARWMVGVATLFLVGALSGCARSGSLPLVSAVGVVHAAGSTPSGWSAPELIRAHELGTPAPAHPPVFDARGDAVVVWTEAKVSIREAITVEYLVRTSVRPVDGHWQSPETLSRLGLDPDVVFDAQGDAIAVWQSPSAVQAAIRPADGSWLAPQTVATPGGEEPQIASDASGDVIAVANRQASGRSTGIQAVLRPAGGTFSPAQTISDPDNDFHPQLAMNSRGDALVAWERDSARGCIVEAAFRPAGGHWSRPQVLSDKHAGCPAGQRVAIDGRGDAVVAWDAQRGRDGVVESAGRSADGRWSAPADPGRGPAHRRNRGTAGWTRGETRSSSGTRRLSKAAGPRSGRALAQPVAVGGRRERSRALAAGRPRSRSTRAAMSCSRGRTSAGSRRPHARRAGPGRSPTRCRCTTRRPGSGRPTALHALDARGDSLVTWQNLEGIKTAWHASLFP